MQLHKPFKYAITHGRFQPFHNEHLAYLRWAHSYGTHLFIGITNFDRTAIQKESTSNHRHTAFANPFTYWERAVMIKDALLEAGVDPSQFTIVALPIHAPKKWSEFVPTDPNESIHLLRVFSEWEQEKAKRLQSAGYQVITEIGSPKLISASTIRKAILFDKNYSDLVPPAVAVWLKRINAKLRLENLNALESQE
jgi:nicotinamide mononucleotide adenylyltransferase